MNNYLKMNKYIALILAVLMLLLSLCSCNFSDINADKDKTEIGFIETPDDLNGKKIACIAGTIQEGLAKAKYTESEFVYCSDFDQCLQEVASGNADGTILSAIQYENLKDNYDSLVSLYPSIYSGTIHYGCPKNDESRKYLLEMNEYIAYLIKSGKLEEYELLSNNKNLEFTAYDFSTLKGTNGTVKYMCTLFDKPLFYEVDGKYAGLEAEILYGFCELYGYKANLIVLDDADFVAALPKGDFNLASTIFHTDEREAIIDFSESYYEDKQVLVCRTASLLDEPIYRDYDALEGQRVAVCVGSLEAELATQILTNSTIDGYSNITDALIAVSEGKAEACCVPESQISAMLDAYENLVCQQKPANESSLYFSFPKNNTGLKLQAELNEYLAEIKSQGKLKEMYDYWLTVKDADSRTVYDFLKIPDINGTITVRFEPLNLPSIHKYKEGFSGFEAELLYGFALEYGYKLDVDVLDWASVLAGVISGMYDMTGFVYYTPERAENILYSSEYKSDGSYFVTRKTERSMELSRKSFIEKTKESFEKNFIREDRWQLMVDGLLVTIKIALFTAFFGTLFGIILCCIQRSSNVILSSIIKIFVRIIQGVPIVVLLLVMYYIIFAKSFISGTTVGIIGFSIDFGVYVSQILISGIAAVDTGQWESAYSLGFNKYRTYTKVIIPQALSNILPVYKGQFISMVKMTSVVGYVAVQDLTKVSDIIRSRTYDAFMPIIATAILYFILAWILTTLISLIEFKIDPTKRKNILSDIDTSKLDLSDADINIESSEVKSDEVVLEIKHLKKAYENITPIEDVNAVVHKGDIISIIGPSGTGKSTFVRMINRLEEPTSGDIYAFGKKVSSNSKELCELRKKIGMVFQSYNLFNHLTVIENIMLAPVVIKGISRQAAYEKGMKLLRRIGLVEKALSYPSELSGGQRQRIALVRALAMDSEIMLLDEPTSALDPAMINEVLQVIEDMAKTGMTMLIVTHEMQFAKKIADRVFYLDEGIIYEEGTSGEIFGNPKKDKTKAFICHLKLFSYEIKNEKENFINIRKALDNFAYQQMMKGRIHNRMMLCIEELITQGLFIGHSDAFPAKLCMEYNENHELKVSLQYNGSKSLLDDINEVSSKIINSSVEILNILLKMENLKFLIK